MPRRLLFVLILAFALRLLSSWFVWGPQALDDYMDALVPAWKMTAGLDPQLHDYRSPLFIWILAAWLGLGEKLGVQEALFQVRWVYFFLACCSMLTIFAVRQITRNQTSWRWRWYPVLITALFAAFPFVGTRCFLESFAISFLTLGVANLERFSQSKKSAVRYAWFGFLLVGFASLIRFQIGVVYLTYLGIFAFRKNWRGIQWGIAAGLVLILVEASIDLSYGRPPMATLLAYFRANQRPEAYGIMAWYNTPITWLGMMFFPFSLMLWPGIKKVWNTYWQIFVVCLVFVFVHTLSPHKEERFLFPILGLSAVLWGSAWAECGTRKWVRWFYNPLFVAVNFLLLLVVCFVNTQVGEIEPPALVGLRSHKVLFLDYDSLVGRGWMKDFFIRAPSQLQNMKAPIEPAAIEAAVSAAPWAEGFTILTTHAEWKDDIAKWSGQKLAGKNCGPLEEATSWIDRLIYQKNPKYNPRRQPTWYLSCWNSGS